MSLFLSIKLIPGDQLLFIFPQKSTGTFFVLRAVRDNDADPAPGIWVVARVSVKSSNLFLVKTTRGNVM